MKIKCLLCSSDNTLSFDEIDGHEIIHLYKPIYGDEISEELSDISSLMYVKCVDCGLHFFSPPLTGTEKFYSLLNKSENYYLEEKTEYSFAKKFIKSSHDVLDIGCGKGAFIKNIQPKSYMGLEFNSDAIELAEAEGVKVIKDDIENFSLNNQLFDVVCAFQVLEHVSDPNMFIKCALDCLKQHGLLIISVPNHDTYLSMLPNAIVNLPPHHVTHWPVKAVKSIGEIFHLDLVGLDYELLSDLHLGGFSNALALKMLNFTHKEWGGIDSSFRGRLKRRIAYRYIAPFVARIFQDNRVRPRGHSVTAVFRKIEGSNNLIKE